MQDIAIMDPIDWDQFKNVKVEIPEVVRTPTEDYRFAFMTALDPPRKIKSVIQGHPKTIEMTETLNKLGLSSGTDESTSTAKSRTDRMSASEQSTPTASKENSPVKENCAPTMDPPKDKMCPAERIVAEDSRVNSVRTLSHINGELSQESESVIARNEADQSQDQAASTPAARQSDTFVTDNCN